MIFTKLNVNLCRTDAKTSRIGGTGKVPKKKKRVFKPNGWKIIILKSRNVVPELLPCLTNEVNVSMQIVYSVIIDPFISNSKKRPSNANAMPMLNYANAMLPTDLWTTKCTQILQ